jgi:hypothetical protein
MMSNQKKKKKPGGVQAELMNALNITPDDIRANENGHITDGQRDRLRQHRQKRERFYAGLALAVTVAVTFWLTVFGFLFGLAENITLLALITLLVAGGLAGVAWFAKRQQLIQQTTADQVESVQGIVVANTENNRLEINGLRLRASADVLRRVRHLEPYVVHYLPGSKIVLSMEYIDNGDNIRHDRADSAADRLQDTESTADDDHLLLDNQADNRTQQRTESS